VLRNLADLTLNNRHLDRRTSVCNKLPANSRPKAIFLRLCNIAGKQGGSVTLSPPPTRARKSDVARPATAASPLQVPVLKREVLHEYELNVEDQFSRPSNAPLGISLPPGPGRPSGINSVESIVRRRALDGCLRPGRVYT